MEDRRNYYEIIDKLSFDPIETKDKKIIDAVELWKLLEDKRGISQEEVDREQRQQELDMYDDIKKCLTNKNMRKAEADKMKKKQTKKLNDIISVLKESSEQNNLCVSNARIISIAKSLRLDKEKTVKRVFESAGFEVIERKAVNITKDILLSDTIFNSICKNIGKLNTLNHKDYSWLNKVSNLYDLVAYYKNDETNIKLIPNELFIPSSQNVIDKGYSLKLYLKKDWRNLI